MQTKPAIPNYNQDKKGIGLRDVAWALFVIVGSYFAWKEYGDLMDYYEELILIGTAIGLIWLGRFWPSFQPVTVVEIGRASCRERV